MQRLAIRGNINVSALFPRSCFFFLTIPANMCFDLGFPFITKFSFHSGVRGSRFLLL